MLDNWGLLTTSRNPLWFGSSLLTQAYAFRVAERLASQSPLVRVSSSKCRYCAEHSYAESKSQSLLVRVAPSETDKDAGETYPLPVAIPSCSGLPF